MMFFIRVFIVFLIAMNSLTIYLLGRLSVPIIHNDEIWYMLREEGFIFEHFTAEIFLQLHFLLAYIWFPVMSFIFLIFLLKKS